MMTGRFRVHEQKGRSFHADVTVSVAPADAPMVDVSPGVFDWMKQAYGPDAKAGTDADEYREAAVYGVNFAINHVEQPRDSIRVTVLEIGFHPCHSDPKCAALAACRATWIAIGDVGLNHPWLESDGVHFADVQ